MRIIILALLTSFALVSGCGGSGDDDPPAPTPITSFELIDPTPGAADQFGFKTVILGNGNIVVVDPFDSSVASKNGAAHLFDPVSQTLIASFYGDNIDDLHGINITALANGNFVIGSPFDDQNGIADAGSVRLVDGDTGVPIGPTIVGDVLGDQLGYITIAFPNGNFVIGSPFDDENGIVDAGSVRLVNGSTGATIGIITGDVEDDQLGGTTFPVSGVTVLANNDYVIVSPLDDENGVVDAGSVRLVNGSSGAQIGNTISGDVADDQLGRKGVTVLANGNFVIASPLDDENGVIDAGSVRLVNGSDATIISTITGDVEQDQLGSDGFTFSAGIIAALANANYVIVSPLDDENGVIDAGSVRLMNGSSGAQIGNTIAGDIMDDKLGSDGITALANNNFVIASSGDNENGLIQAGSVRLVNGGDGMPISILTGDAVRDFIGASGTTALTNNNFVIASHSDTVNGIKGGSVRLMNGSSGAQIGGAITGDVTGDLLGFSSITALANNNFVIASHFDDENGVVDAGSVKLVDGGSGLQIGNTIAGDVMDDQLGFGGITALANGSFVIASRRDDENAVVDAGSVQLIDGSNGAQIGATFAGDVTGDMGSTGVIGSANGDFFIIHSRLWDNNGLVDSGRVRLIAQ